METSENVFGCSQRVVHWFVLQNTYRDLQKVLVELFSLQDIDDMGLVRQTGLFQEGADLLTAIVPDTKVNINGKGSRSSEEMGNADKRATECRRSEDRPG